MADGHVVPMVIHGMSEVAETVSVAAVAVETIEEPTQMDVQVVSLPAKRLPPRCGTPHATACARDANGPWRARVAWDGRGTIGQGTHNTKK